MKHTFYVYIGGSAKEENWTGSTEFCEQHLSYSTRYYSLNLQQQKIQKSFRRQYIYIN
jgi:hypothetical protein